MPALTINGVTVQVRTTSGSGSQEDRDTVFRTFGGSLAYMTKGTATKARERSFLTPVDMPEVERDALWDMLDAAEYVEVEGELWGDPSDALVVELSDSEGPLLGQVPIRFTLRESLT